MKKFVARMKTSKGIHSIVIHTGTISDARSIAAKTVGIKNIMSIKELKSPIKNLIPECGVTNISLKNGEVLLKALGFPVRVELHQGLFGVFLVVAMYTSGDWFEFTGFGWGYGGEGPRGLRAWCQSNKIPLTWEVIQTLQLSPKENSSLVWAWPE